MTRLEGKIKLTRETYFYRNWWEKSSGRIPWSVRYYFTVLTISYPANTRGWADAGLMLGQRRRRWSNIQTALTQLFVFAVLPCVLSCKTKRQYLLTLQVSRYCLLALHSSIILQWYSIYTAAITTQFTISTYTKSDNIYSQYSNNQLLIRLSTDALTHESYPCFLCTQNYSLASTIYNCHLKYSVFLNKIPFIHYLFFTMPMTKENN